MQWSKEALFKFNLDGAFLMELVGRTEEIKLMDSIGKENFPGVICMWKEVSVQEFLEPPKGALNNGVASGLRPLHTLRNLSRGEPADEY